MFHYLIVNTIFWCLQNLIGLILYKTNVEMSKFFSHSMAINEFRVIIHSRKFVDHDNEIVIRNDSTHSMRS